MRSIEGIFKALGLGIGCVYALFSFDFPILDYGIFLLILLTAGIPHGAIDHLTSNPHTNQKSLIRFLINYLSLIAAYLLIRSEERRVGKECRSRTGRISSYVRLSLRTNSLYQAGSC
mgnify:CR=1 FL=1